MSPTSCLSLSSVSVCLPEREMERMRTETTATMGTMGMQRKTGTSTTTTPIKREWYSDRFTPVRESCNWEIRFSMIQVSQEETCDHGLPSCQLMSRAREMRTNESNSFP